VSYQLEAEFEAKLVELLFGQVLAQFGHQGVPLYTNGRHLDKTIMKFLLSGAISDEIFSRRKVNTDGDKSALRSVTCGLLLMTSFPEKVMRAENFSNNFFG
jgi:hypothetical protein